MQTTVYEGHRESRVLKRVKGYSLKMAAAIGLGDTFLKDRGKGGFLGGVRDIARAGKAWSSLQPRLGGKAGILLEVRSSARFDGAKWKLTHDFTNQGVEPVSISLPLPQSIRGALDDLLRSGQSRETAMETASDIVQVPLTLVLHREDGRLIGIFDIPMLVPVEQE